MATTIELLNRGLLKLGCDRIESLGDDLEEARAAAAVWPTVRDFVLSAAAWRFAMHRTTLATLGPTPAFGYLHALQLPSDCLRLYQAGEDLVAMRLYRGAVEGGYLLTNQAAPVPVRYVRRVEDASRYHPDFVEAAACRLAAEACERLTGNRGLLELLDQQFRLALEHGRAHDAIESDPLALAETGPWVESRL
jgi:hypothetical protein